MLDKEMARGRGGYVPTVPTQNRYKVRHIRMEDKIWEKLKYKRQKSLKSWNQFIKDIIK